MDVRSSANYERSFKKVLKRHPNLKSKVQSKLAIFAQNRNHPSLKLHKLTGELKKDWSIFLDDDLRLIFIYVPDGILLLDIGKHEEVY